MIVRMPPYVGHEPQGAGGRRSGTEKGLTGSKGNGEPRRVEVVVHTESIWAKEIFKHV